MDEIKLLLEVMKPMKKGKKFFRFLTLIINALNLVLLLINLVVTLPIWFTFLITLVDCILTTINSAYDWDDVRNHSSSDH